MARRAINDFYAELKVTRGELTVLHQQLRCSTRIRLTLDTLLPVRMDLYGALLKMEGDSMQTDMADEPPPQFPF